MEAPQLVLAPVPPFSIFGEHFTIPQPSQKGPAICRRKMQKVIVTVTVPLSSIINVINPSLSITGTWWAAVSLAGSFPLRSFWLGAWCLLVDFGNHLHGGLWRPGGIDHQSPRGRKGRRVAGRCPTPTWAKWWEVFEAQPSERLVMFFASWCSPSDEKQRRRRDRIFHEGTISGSDFGSVWLWWSKRRCPRYNYPKIAGIAGWFFPQWVIS